MIKAIIFDCFGVLYHGSTHAMMQLTPRDRRTELLDAGRSFDYGYISRDEYLQVASEATGKSIDEVIAIRKERHSRNVALVAELRRLKQTYKIGLLSNVGYDSLRTELFSEAEISELFDAMVLSSDVHLVKPDPAIFSLMATKLGLLPEECIMIDDLEANIAGAAEAGMPGIVFVSNEQLAADLSRLLSGAE